MPVDIKVVCAIIIVLLILLTIYVCRPRKNGETMTSGPLFDAYNKQYGGEKRPVLGLHYTDWCHFCKDFKPKWAALKDDQELKNILFVENNEDHNKTPGVSGYPTIILRKPSGEVVSYDEAREADALKTWLHHQGV